MDLKGKRLLILGGKPIGSREITEYAKSRGVYTIVADYLPPEQSAAKQISDEAWDISTGDVDLLVQMVRDHQVDGIYTGVHEFNISKMIEVCQQTGLPCFCKADQWELLSDKRRFKQLCREYDIPVAKEYRITMADDIDGAAIDFPVIIKPADGSGSRGFSICRDKDELKQAFPNAVKNSGTGSVLVEQMMDYTQSCIINYTLFNGQVVFSGISDKESKKVFATGAPVMSVQFYPSRFEGAYLEQLDEKVKKMLCGAGLKNGVVWIEAFCNRGSFTFNEAGYRFGGSLTYYPVERIYGVKQLQAQIEYALSGTYSDPLPRPDVRASYHKTYTIMPVHVRPGRIASVSGFEQLRDMPGFLQAVPVHFVGDRIENWGSAQQVFAYLHYETETREESTAFADEILKCLSVRDETGKEMLFNLYR